MSFINLNLKSEYRSFQDNIIEEFYNPVLSKSISYKRAVGYFSSTALIEILAGIKGLINNEGKIFLIASPQLTMEDIEAIKSGYKSREQVITDSIERQINWDINDELSKKKMNILSFLIAEGYMDIKIALIESSNEIGIYHEKLGILEDQIGNKIVFSGSLNETRAALNYNYESFDVFCSWTTESDRVNSKVHSFNQLWNNYVDQVSVIEFPKVSKEKFKKFVFEEPDWEILENGHGEVRIKAINVEPSIPLSVKIRDYQEQAFRNWEKNDYRGIFDMATGTGKTFTGLASAVKLYEKIGSLAVVIVCPYQHLVEQWCKDIELFGMRPIVGYSASKQRDWKRKLINEIEYFNFGVKKHFCFITTNATFSSTLVQERLKEIEENLLLIVDEAHNFGANYLKTKLLPNANYRIGLSATIERHQDEEGTNALRSYFGDLCIQYTLEDAILAGMLTPYFYYPILVYLTSEEMEDYKKITKEIVKTIKKDKNGQKYFTESAKYLLIKRAQLIAGAKNKLEALKKEISRYKEDSHMLVYCGSTTVNDPGYIEETPDVEEIKQIDAVTKLLGNELNMKVSRFTSQETAAERESIKKSFAEGESLQTLVAIRCLDEGVDIPSIKTAFILASSTNPKEYIQRRGRVLRLYEGKKNAEIYDFITLPLPTEEIFSMEGNGAITYKGLVKREVDRMKSFASIAENSSLATELVDELERNYYLYELNNPEEESFNV